MKRNLWYLTGLLVVVIGCSSPVDPSSQLNNSISSQSQLPISDQPDLQRPQPHGKPETRDTVGIVP